MDMMPLRITIFFHAFPSLVYSILFYPVFTIIKSQEENDQAFSVAI